MKSKNINLSLTGIFVKDAEHNKVAVFFAEFPEVIAQGDNENEAIANLFDTFQDALKDKKQRISFPDNCSDAYISKPVNLVLQ